MGWFTRLASAVLLLGLSLSAQAATDTKAQMAQAYGLYKKGSYSQAVHALKTIQASRQDQAMVNYWLGICQARMQEFDQAVASLRKARQLGFDAEDLDYELGQAHFARQELRSAREAFRAAQARKYKLGASTYYLGYIHQQLKEFPAALASYDAIRKMPQDTEKVKQAAIFQTAEIRLTEAQALRDEKKKKDALKTIVIPEYKRVIAYASKTDMAIQADSRIQEIRAQVGIDIPRFANGTPISSKPWFLKVGTDTKYDSNVITEADQALTQVSNRGSMVQKTTIFGKYEYVLSDTWAIGPELSVNHAHHFNRDTPEVFKNDGVTVSPSIKARHEHRFAGSPAALMMNFEFMHMMQDVRRDQSLGYYSRSYNLVVGERARLFGNGSSSIMANVKFYENYDQNYNAFDPGLSLSHGFNWEGSQLTLALSGDYNRAKSAINDKTNYRLSTAYGLQKLAWGVDLSLALELALVDTMNQSSTRGTEKTINPSLNLTREWLRDFSTTLSYAYTRNISDDKQSYDYSRSLFGMALNYYF